MGTYRGRRMLAASFSPDGSLLAVAASELVTLWNPATNSLVRVLSNTFTSSTHPLSPIHHLAFVKQSNCLVTGSSHFRSLLTVWDLSTLSVRWSLSTSVESLTVDPVQANFAVLIGPSRADPGDRGSSLHSDFLALSSLICSAMNALVKFYLSCFFLVNMTFCVLVFLVIIVGLIHWSVCRMDSMEQGWRHSLV